jgi:hypothetical protein
VPVLLFLLTLQLAHQLLTPEAIASLTLVRLNLYLLLLWETFERTDASESKPPFQPEVFVPVHQFSADNLRFLNLKPYPLLTRFDLAQAVKVLVPDSFAESYHMSPYSRDRVVDLSSKPFSETLSLEE